MPFYGDPAEMEATAGRIEARVETVRLEAARLRRNVATIGWHSTASERFKRAVDEDLVRLLTAANELAEAAITLREHALTVRRRLGEIAAFERDVRQWFERRAAEISNLAEAAADVGSTVIRVLRNPFSAARTIAQELPWQHWPWQPDRLPGPGDITWLEVARDLRNRGVPV